MKLDFLTSKEQPRFKLEEMNTRTYWRHVKKALAKGLGYKMPDWSVCHSLYRTFERSGGEASLIPSPDYDALCMLIQRPRNNFDSDGILATYPSLVKTIEDLRSKIFECK